MQVGASAHLPTARIIIVMSVCVGVIIVRWLDACIRRLGWAAIAHRYYFHSSLLRHLERPLLERTQRTYRYTEVY